MTLGDRAWIEKRESIAAEMLTFVDASPHSAWYPMDLEERWIGIYPTIGRQMAISAVWRLIGDHQVELDNRLMVRSWKRPTG